MKFGSRQIAIRALPVAVVFLVASISAASQPQTSPSGQTPQSRQAAVVQKQPLAGDFFRNVQVLRNIPVDEFMGTMGFISASLSLNCLDCHVNESASDFAKYAEDTPIKATARKMILMVNNINKENFAGRPVITCYACHRSDTRPRLVPSLAEQYGMPLPPDPNDIEIVGPPAPGDFSASQILDKYLAAIGGAQKLAALTSFVAKGTYAGYDTDFGKYPAEVYAKAPSQRTSVIHPPGGDSTTAFDGSSGWIAATNTQLPMVALTGGELDGVRLDAQLSFPGRIAQSLTGLRTGFPPTEVDDHNVQVVQGTAQGGSRVKLFFDRDSGLLIRQVRFATTALGLNPVQIDYTDYREVTGVKIPFHYTVTWTDGRSEFEFTEVKPNVAIDAAIFAKPAPIKPGSP